jgi:pimeloyl-ACP methyl ester carboxylesterase
MTFWKSLHGAGLIVLLLVLTVSVGAVGLRVYRVTHPPRSIEALGELSTALVEIEEVRFRSADGVDLGGWLLEGRPDFPPLVLCHDLGAGKSSLINLALLLQGEGHTVLLFDFRGHGESGGHGSGLGIDEKRDVVGAIDFLAARRREEDGPPLVGVYGVGMGAHAAVLAAEDRNEVRVLVLDGLYPDAGHHLVRQVFGRWEFGVDNLGFLPRGMFSLFRRGSTDGQSAAAVLPRLLGRDLLLVAPAGNTSVLNEMQRLYETIPDQQDADGNLITLPSSGGGQLYGEDSRIYNARVAGFFSSRLRS